MKWAVIIVLAVAAALVIAFLFIFDSGDVIQSDGKTVPSEKHLNGPHN